jgi:hypothetical protein
MIVAKPPPIKIHGIRSPIPPGYVLGRTSRGQGDVELISLSKLGNALVTAGQGGGGGGGGPGVAGNQTTTQISPTSFMFLGFTAEGPFIASEQFLLALATRSVLMPSYSAASSRHVAQCYSAPTADTSFVLTNDLADYLANGTSVVCTVSFAAGSKTGTFTWPASATTITSGTALWAVFPVSPDATLAGVQTLWCGDPQ